MMKLVLVLALLVVLTPGALAAEEITPLNHPEDEDHDSPGFEIPLGIAALALGARVVRSRKLK